MLLWLLKLINPVKAITKEIGLWRERELNAETEAKRIEANLAQSQLMAQRDVLLSEQAHFLTRAIRPLFALPFIVFIWKVVVWDTVLGLGATPHLSPQMYDIMGIIIGAYFVFRGAEKVVRIYKNAS